MAKAASGLERDRPAIHLIDTEADALAGLALKIEHSAPELSAQLLSEIDRADLHGASELPSNTVAMGSHIEFVDEGSGQRRTVQLVYPHDADIEAGRISILTPVGAGLIGVAEGASILWPDREGHQRRLRIIRVTRSD